MSISNNGGDVYVDFQGLAQLKANAANKPSAETNEKVAEQFEAVFLQMMLKSMRQATASMGEGLFDSDQSRMYQEMFDQQIALDMAKKRQGGIADAVLRQLNGETTTTAPVTTLNQDRLHFKLPAAVTAVETNKVESAEAIKGFDSSDDFVQKLWPLAQKYADKLGVEPQVLIAQAALETGWGQGVSRRSNGETSHNLFNIKADERWDGARVRVSTLEFEQGVAKRQFADFRAYPSFEASFKDYVDFLQTSPRYQNALTQADDPSAYVNALQEAGYATDPKYADKVINIMGREPFQQQTSRLNNLADDPLS